MDISETQKLKNILIYNSGGGLGDSIQLFSLILSLQEHYKHSKLYYLGSHKNHFRDKLKDYNIKIETLDLNLKYFGFRWWHYFFIKNNFLKMGINRFDLIIDLQSKIRNTFLLKKLPHIHFYSSTYNFNFCSASKQFTRDHNLTNMLIDNLNILLDTNILKIDYNLDFIKKDLLIEAKKLLPNNSYVGFSITQGNQYRKKKWGLEKFIRLANKIKDKNKVPVFFIEESNEVLISRIKLEVSNALFPEMKSSKKCPALVTALATRLEKAITIDNGVMHMIGLAKIPLIVLFGPTNSKKFAPKNKNVTILDSKEIYKSNDISKIGVEDVMRFFNS